MGSVGEQACLEDCSHSVVSGGNADGRIESRWEAMHMYALSELEASHS